MARLRACCTAHAAVGRAVTPARCNLRVRLHVRGGQLGQQHLPQIRREIQPDMRGVTPQGGTGRGGSGDEPVCQPVPYRVSIHTPVSPGRGVRSRASTATAALREG
jgi:hypothetical protein